MRQHFRTQHPHDTIVVNGKRLPQCPSCGIFQNNAMTTAHQQSKDCLKWTKTQHHRASKATTQRLVRTTTFTIGEMEIENVQEFRYLGRILENRDADTATVDSNLHKARMKWGRLGKILTSQGAYPKVMATFYKAIVESVLLYGAETWVLSKELERKLQSFHHRCARYISREHIRKDDHDQWIAPPSNQVLQNLGLQTIQEYILQRKKTVSTYAKTTDIFQLCKESRPLASAPNQSVWWE
jgi:hypothetical protein